MNERTEQQSTFWKWRIVLGVICFCFGATSLTLGLALYCFGPFSVFHPNEQQQQIEVLDKIRQHVVSASTSYSVNVAKQQLTEAVAEVEQYRKAQPIAEIAGSEFESWYKGTLEVKHRLDLAEQVENSDASALQKLQAEAIALESLKNFAEIKQTNILRVNLGVKYNVPSSIPLRLKVGLLEAEVTTLYWLLFFIGIAAIALPIIFVFNDNSE